MWKQFTKDYLHFTAKERKAIVIIVIIIIALIVSPLFFPLFAKQEVINHSEFDNEIAKLEEEKADSTQFTARKYDHKYSGEYLKNESRDESVKAEVFSFDPNTASASDWKRLGLRDKTIHTIQNYLSKGGRFYKAEDIKKIWGLSPSDAQRLIPYVSIIEKTPFEKNSYSKTTFVYASNTTKPIDINAADTSIFISLPGIGSRLANRIIAFREKLGGFYSVDQVSETYMLPDSTFQKIKQRLNVGSSTVKQIKINRASIDEMKTHPYLRYNLANAIFQYRQQHGDFKSIEEIKKIMLVTDDVFQKIAPYLSVD